MKGAVPHFGQTPCCGRKNNMACDKLCRRLPGQLSKSKIRPFCQGNRQGLLYACRCQICLTYASITANEGKQSTAFLPVLIILLLMLWRLNFTQGNTPFFEMFTMDVSHFQRGITFSGRVSWTENLQNGRCSLFCRSPRSHHHPAALHPG